MSERTMQERLRDAIPDGTLLDEAADKMDQLEAEVERLRIEIARLQSENERLHFDYTRLADRKPIDWDLINSFSGIAMDAIALAKELFQTHPDPYDTGYRLEQLEASYREVSERV